MERKALKDVKDSDEWRYKNVDDIPNIIIEMREYEKAWKCLKNTECFQVDDR